MQTFQEISHLLSIPRINEAIHALHPWIKQVGKGEYEERLHSIQDNYSLLVSYYLDNYDDPQFSSVLASIQVDLFRLLDDLHLAVNLSELSTNYYQKLFAFEHVDCHTFSERFAYARELSEEEEDVFTRFCIMTTRTEADENTLLVFIGALFCRLLHQFSESGLLLLLFAVQHAPDYAANRAIACLQPLLLYYDDRLSLYPRIKEKFCQILHSNNATYQSCVNILFAWTRYLGMPLVEDVCEKFSNDIKPSLNKHLPNLLKMMQANEQGDTNQDGAKEQIEEELLETLQMHVPSMNELAKNKMDVAFCLYKHYYQAQYFSDSISNWFVPFRSNFVHADEKIVHSIFPIIASFPDMCTLDRYAVAAMMAEQMSASPVGASPFSFLMELSHKSTGVPIEKDGQVRNIYRFLRLNPFGIQDISGIFVNIYGSHLWQWFALPTQKQIDLSSILSYCGEYEKAEQILLHIEHTASSPKLLFMLGKLYVQQTRFEDAIDAFERSYKAKASRESLAHLVFSLMSMGYYEDALIYINQLLQLVPQSKAVLLDKATILMQLELYAEALDIFCKLDTLSPNQPKVMAGLGWCAFVGDHVFANSYLKKASDNPFETIDIVRYGHYLLSNHLRQEAMQQYKRAKALYPSQEQFVSSFLLDQSILLEKGVSSSEISVLLDQLS